MKKHIHPTEFWSLFVLHAKSNSESRLGETLKPILGKLIVLENTFHERQELPLFLGENVIGRYIKGTSANAPIITSDPSIDTTHCIITVKHNKQQKLLFVLRDAPSLTGTFYQGNILRDQDRIFIENDAVINIGGTTLIAKTDIKN